MIVKVPNNISMLLMARQIALGVGVSMSVPPTLEFVHSRVRVPGMIVKVPNNMEPNVNVPVARRGQTGDNGVCTGVASAVHHGRPGRLHLRPKGFAMSNTTISKGGLSATISSKGAELTSLKLDGREYL